MVSGTTGGTRWLRSGGVDAWGRKLLGALNLLPDSGVPPPTPLAYVRPRPPRHRRFVGAEWWVRAKSWRQARAHVHQSPVSEIGSVAELGLGPCGTPGVHGRGTESSTQDDDVLDEQYFYEDLSPSSAAGTDSGDGAQRQLLVVTAAELDAEPEDDLSAYEHLRPPSPAPATAKVRSAPLPALQPLLPPGPHPHLQPYVRSVSGGRDALALALARSAHHQSQALPPLTGFYSERWASEGAAPHTPEVPESLCRTPGEFLRAYS